MSKKILIIDDSMYMRTLIKEALTREGYDIVAEATNGEKAIELVMQFEPDLITLDNILPDMIGTDVLRTLKEEGLVTKVIMISAVGQQSVINEGIELGATEYIIKPFTDDYLVEVVNRII